MSDPPLVLCVDDEPNILRSLKRLLRREPYRVLTAEGAAAGLEILERETPALVISDYRMPHMTGLEFLAEVRVRLPHTLRVVLSGYAEVSLVLKAINEGLIYRFITKPWDDEQLKAHIRQCLAAHATLRENRELNQRVRDQNEELLRLNRRLEQLLEGRTYSLTLSQELIHHLPLGVFGISADGLVVLANEAATLDCPDLAYGLGLPASEVLSPVLASEIDRALSEGKSAHCSFDQHRARIEPVGEAEDRGCVVILQRAGYGC